MLTWEIVFVPALLCVLAGILVAMAWLEQAFFGDHEVVLLPIAERPASQRHGEMSG